MDRERLDDRKERSKFSPERVSGLAKKQKVGGHEEGSFVGTSQISRLRIGPLFSIACILSSYFAVSLFGWCLLLTCTLLVFKFIQVLFVLSGEGTQRQI